MFTTPFLHRLNASLSICFPIYISFPYQTQNLLGGIFKIIIIIINYFVVVSHLVVVGVLPHLQQKYFILFKINKFNYSKNRSDNHNLNISEFQQSSIIMIIIIIIIIIILVQKSYKVFDCTVVS
jgi:hypothetical protein